MKIKLDQQLIDTEGKPITRGSNPAITLKDIIINAMLTYINGEQKEVKLKKYEIFKKIRDEKTEVVLTGEEITLIKDTIGIIEPPLILGQSFEMIENN